ncbi:NACHT, LRR and PYD domains-containing protein 12-like [Brachyhypopomus gauderio]|uniref:NACHT, LRR and PYD domains-containing protein 12-like n=1 Tax=Brachyhypopomus gauderio TaxID=698409 RepID=UPI00404159FE
MLLTVCENATELSLACLVMLLSILFWRWRSRRTINSRHSKDTCESRLGPNTAHKQPGLSQDERRMYVTGNQLHSDHDVVPGSVCSPLVQTPCSPPIGCSIVQTPPTVPTGCSVAVSAEHGSSVAAPTFNSNNFYSANFTFTTKSADNESFEEQKAHLDCVKNILESHKANMKKKIECIFEGKKDLKNKIHLKKVYTQVFITEGELKDVNKEHEILKIDKAFGMKKCQDTPINCNQIFNLPWKDETNKLVLTKGVAGIGKTVSVQKFILDWAEKEANEDIDCIFLLPFREINLVKDEEYSFHELLLEFHPELAKLKETEMYEGHKLVFIFDGLDESRLPLDFNGRMVRSITKKASVDALITSLISGNILPSALIWITSRPAAAHQVPSEYVSLFTEVRGFTDEQKEEYFRKRIPDENEASKIIYHIKTSRSLHIMCHIPVFCWITATVLQAMLVENQGEDIPTTLTEMYIHFLLIQMNIKNQKYDMKVERDMTKLMESNRGMILKLAKLAFEQLKEENIMFYEDDLRACGIGITEDSEYSGICTEIFKQESVLHEKKVYCFIHLSVQEFLAALHVFCCFLKKNIDELQFFFDIFPTIIPTNLQLDLLLKKAIDKAKHSEKGHLDLFLRFLLGISLDSNQKLLIGLLPHTENTKKSISKVIQHIRQMQNKNPELPPETSINQFFCLLELKDRSLYNQIKKYMNVEKFPERELSLSNCSALAYMLLMSEEVLDEFNPKKYNESNAACRRLVPAVRCCRKALLARCELTETCCEDVSAALQDENSLLRELDLSDNYIIETGAQHLSSGLKSSHCKLEMLRLARCHFTQNTCAELASALSSILSCCLKELDLSNNDLEDSGLKQLLSGFQNSCCKLGILRLGWCKLTEKSCVFLSSILHCGSDPPLRELDLSNNDLQDTGIKLLSSGLKDPTCRLEILGLSGCLVTEEGCSSLASALSSNPSHLKELDLTYNHPGESGVKLLSARLEDPHCTLLLKTDPKGEVFIKPGMRKYSCALTFDPNTAHQVLCLSDADTKVTNMYEHQQHPDHPDRFEMFSQVLCKESLSGRCYWEVDFKDSDPAIGVTYQDIQRKEVGIALFDAQAQIGLNGLSWCLSCIYNGYQASHDSVHITIHAADSQSSRIGVYLDWTASTLSFYRISSHTQTHIHTFQVAFQKPVYAAFALNKGSVALCQMD